MLQSERHCRCYWHYSALQAAETCRQSGVYSHSFPIHSSCRLASKSPSLTTNKIREDSRLLASCVNQSVSQWEARALLRIRDLQTLELRKDFEGSCQFRLKNLPKRKGKERREKGDGAWSLAWRAAFSSLSRPGVPPPGAEPTASLAFKAVADAARGIALGFALALARDCPVKGIRGLVAMGALEAALLAFSELCARAKFDA